MSHPIGIFLAGLFIAHLEVGGFNIQLYNFVPEVIDMIIAVIIYCGAFALLFKQIISKFIIHDTDEDLSLIHIFTRADLSLSIRDEINFKESNIRAMNKFKDKKNSPYFEEIGRRLGFKYPYKACLLYTSRCV